MGAGELMLLCLLWDTIVCVCLCGGGLHSWNGRLYIFFSHRHLISTTWYETWPVAKRKVGHNKTSQHTTFSREVKTFLFFFLNREMQHTVHFYFLKMYPVSNNFSILTALSWLCICGGTGYLCSLVGKGMLALLTRTRVFSSEITPKSSVWSNVSVCD